MPPDLFADRWTPVNFAVTILRRYLSDQFLKRILGFSNGGEAQFTFDNAKFHPGTVIQAQL